MCWGWVRDNFDTVFTTLLLWFTAGAVFDAWNHNQGAPITFFTVEHAVAYSAVTAFGIVIAGLFYDAWRHGDPLRSAIPAGYRVSLLGVPVMAVGGVGDLLWHRVFGFEVASQEMLSPSHLLLGMGAVLLVVGPLRAAWDDDRPGTWRAQFPIVVAGGLLLGFTTFMMQYFHPFAVPVAASWVPRTSTAWALLGIAGIILHSVAMVAILLRLLVQFRLPFGAVTAVLGGVSVATAAMQGHTVFIAPSVVTGVLADLAYQVSPPDTAWWLRGFAFLLPAVLFALYFAVIAAVGSIAWTVHVWSGSIVLAGTVGLLTSYALFPRYPAGR